MPQVDQKPSSVTALLPAWQSADFIQATLDSLSAQTYEHFQVIISVDLCEDETYAVCSQHAAQDPRFRVVQQTRRMGYVGNCNALLDLADSDYAMLTFHDDQLAPDYISRLVEALDTSPEAVMAYSDLLLTYEDGRKEEMAFTGLEGLSDPAQRGARMLKPVHGWWLPNRGLFRLAQARRINGLKAHAAGEFSTDWPWMFHMSLLGEFVRVPQMLCYKNFMTGSLSRGWNYTTAQWAAVRAACMRELGNSPLPAKDRIILSLVSFFWGSTRPLRVKIIQLRQTMRTSNKDCRD